MKKDAFSSIALLLCLVAAASLVQPVDARNGWQRFVDFIVPEPFREFLGGSPSEPTEPALRILSEADILELERPLDGTVEAGETHPLRLSFPASGDKMPNILLSLSILNENGDADLYCMPEFLFTEGEAPPSASFSVWKSEHSQGADHIFISRMHELYQDSRVDVTEFGNNGVSFVCSIVGFSPTGTDYLLEVDVDYSDRELVREEKSAMQNIFDGCCLGSPDSCQPWKETLNEDGSITMEMCHIPGNICNEDGNLIRLDLSDIGMQCEFPGALIGKLTKLQKLDLSSNMIRGEVSEVLDTLSGLEDLEFIDLNNNALKGSLDDSMLGDLPICKLTHERELTFLNLGDNEIVTKLPRCMFDNRSKLRDFTLDGNTVEGGIPPVSEDAAIKVLRLKGVGLTGTIPKNIGSWENLLVLNLADNSLEGPIPRSLGKISPLLSLNLEENRLTGPIPDSLAVGSHLKYLRLSNNTLESFGSQWYELESMEESKLQILELSGNSIEGPFPIATGFAPNLQVLVLADNNISDRIVVQPKMFPKVVVFMIQNNNIRGGISRFFGDMGFYNQKVRNDSPYFPEFDIANNQFIGEIPEHMWAMNVPEFLWESIRVGGNNFDVPCPLSLNLIHLKDLVCENGESPADGLPLDLTTSSSSSEEQLVEDVTEDEPVLIEPVEEPEAEIEYSEAALASIDTELSGDGETSLLAASEPVSNPLVGEQNADSSEDAKTIVAQIGGYKVIGAAGLCLMIIALIAVIAVVARKKRNNSKSEVLSDVLAMDLEMPPVAEAADEGDNQILLDRVKPSSVL